MQMVQLARARFRLLLEQLVAEGQSQHSIAKALGVSQGAVSFILKGDRDVGLDLLAVAVERLHIRAEFFFDPTLEDPHYRLFVGHESRVEDEHTDWPAWKDLEANGTVAKFRALGLSDAIIESVRRTPWRGPPEPRDYERMLEAAQLGSQRAPEDARSVEARERREREGKPDLSDALRRRGRSRS